jgi:hypothetical protein
VINTTPLEKLLRSMRRWQYVMILLFGFNVFFAAHWVITPHSLGVGWQAAGVALNIWASVFAWDAVKKNERMRSEVRSMLARAREFNRIFTS